MTNGEFVSRVLNGLNATTKDSVIGRRYVLKIGQNKSKFYISQKLDDKTLYREDNLFRTIRCFKLKNISSRTCGIYEFESCESLMKSVDKLPGLLFSKFGPSIVRITTAGGQELKYTTPSLYSTNKDNIYFKLFRNNYYYVDGGYIYLPDSEVAYIDVTYIPYDTSEIDNLSTCNNNGVQTCTSLWDHKFNVPDKLSEQVISETINEVSMKVRLPRDENPNRDINSKTTTP